MAIALVLRYGLIIWGNGSYVKRVIEAQNKCTHAVCDIDVRELCKTLFGDILTIICNVYTKFVKH